MGLLSFITGSNNEQVAKCRYTRNDEGHAVDVYASVKGRKERGPLTDASMMRLYNATKRAGWEDKNNQNRAAKRWPWQR